MKDVPCRRRETMNDCDGAVTLEHTAGRSRSAQTLGALTVYHLVSGFFLVES